MRVGALALSSGWAAAATVRQRARAVGRPFPARAAWWNRATRQPITCSGTSIATSPVPRAAAGGAAGKGIMAESAAGFEAYRKTCFPDVRMRTEGPVPATLRPSGGLAGPTVAAKANPRAGRRMFRADCCSTALVTSLRAMAVSSCNLRESLRVRRGGRSRGDLGAAPAISG